MKLREFLGAVKIRWYLPVLMVVIAVAAHEVWLRWGAVRTYAARTTVRIDVGEETRSAILRGRDFLNWEVLDLAFRILRGDEKPRSEALGDPERLGQIEKLRGHLILDGLDEAEVHQFLERLETSTRAHLTEDGEEAELFAFATRPEEALVFSWVIAEAARIYYEETLRGALIEKLERLRERQSFLEKERDAASRDFRENSTRHGISNYPEREALVRRLLIDTEAEIHQLESLRLELSHRIDEEELDVVHGQSGGAVVETRRAAELREELLRAKLEYEVRSSNLPEKHPRVLRISERVRKLEALLGEAERRVASGDGHRGEGVGKETNESVESLRNRFREATSRLDSLSKKRDELFGELARVREIGPGLENMEGSMAHAHQRIDGVRADVKDVEWILRDFEPVRVARLARVTQLVPKPLGSLGWRLGVFLSSLFLGLALAWVFHLLDTHLYTDREVRLFLQLPLLAIIPRMSRKERYLPGSQANRKNVEKFNATATIIHSVARELDMKVFSVASANTGEGKTTVSIHLAAALARKGFKVALVEGDLRQPALYNAFGVNNEVGLSSLLEKQYELQEVVDGLLPEEYDSQDIEEIHAVELLHETHVENLYLLPGGPPLRSPISAIEGPQMQRVLKELSAAMDYVIVDTPPVLGAGEALSLVSMSDGCLLVVGAGQCESGDALWIKHLFSNVQATVLGVILNRCSRDGLVDFGRRDEAQRLADRSVPV